MMIVAGFMAIILNLVLPEEIDDETVSITANEADAAADAEEWRRIQHGKANGTGKDEETGENSSDGRQMSTEK